MSAEKIIKNIFSGRETIGKQSNETEQRAEETR